MRGRWIIQVSLVGAVAVAACSRSTDSGPNRASAGGGAGHGGSARAGAEQGGSAGKGRAGTSSGNAAGTPDIEAGAPNEAGTSGDRGAGGTSGAGPAGGTLGKGGDADAGDGGDGASPGTQLGTCPDYSKKLTSCGLIKGTIDCSAASKHPVELCSYGCVQAADCVHVEEFICLALPNAIEDCLAACRGFTCDDGRSIPLAYRCDGIPDCEGEEDEAGCTMCDGGPIEGDYFCDGVDDCSDGRDELDCPVEPRFTCASGDTVPGPYRCDNYRDCADGSDENGCAALTCAP